MGAGRPTRHVTVAHGMRGHRPQNLGSHGGSHRTGTRRCCSQAMRQETIHLHLLLPVGGAVLTGGEMAVEVTRVDGMKAIRLLKPELSGVAGEVVHRPPSFSYALRNDSRARSSRTLIAPSDVP